MSLLSVNLLDLNVLSMVFVAVAIVVLAAGLRRQNRGARP